MRRRVPESDRRKQSRRGAVRRAACTSFAWLAVTACGDGGSGASGDTGTSSAATTGDDDGESGGVETSGGIEGCVAPEGVSASPTTIAATVELLNALPHPVTLDCFLQALDRPLRINATNSTVSLQPAAGDESPRVFLFIEGLILSVAIGGDGAGPSLLEFGERVGETKSIKAEIPFPLPDPITIDTPFENLFEDGRTKCALCHGGEAPYEHGPYTGAFTSDALTFLDDELIELVDLEAQWMTCEPAAEPDRCARLDALFGFGPVEFQDFPASFPTIYDYG